MKDKNQTNDNILTFMQRRGIQSSIITNHPTQKIPTNPLHQKMVQHFPNHHLIKMKKYIYIL
jgi:hypothetical protein